MHRLILTNGIIIDGSGKEGYKGDIALTKDKITAIGTVKPNPGDTIENISGKIVTPGFVDIHSHSDYYLIIDPKARSKVHQGVTTEVGGNCGYSAAPVYGPPLAERKKQYLSQFGINHNWSSLSSYFDRLTKQGISLNYAHLVGTNTIRASVMGFEDRDPSPDEINRMVGLVMEGMDQGAIGLSYGLAYVPSCYSKEDELVALARAAAGANRLITSHIRSESIGLIDAIKEMISIAKKSGASLQISHLKTLGQENWNKLDKVFSLIEEAIKDGVSITCDRYPYLAANTGLQSILPGWVLAGGKEKCLERLNDPTQRKTITEELIASHPTPDFWENVMVSQVVTEKNKGVEGKSIRESASKAGKTDHDFFFELLIDENMDVDSIFFSMNEKNLERILKKEYVMIGSDAGARSMTGPLGEGYPHPRTFGTFPRAIAEFVREKRILDLPTVIQKMTHAPCTKFGIQKRGLIKKGYFADLVVFDPKTISDLSTYQQPKKFPSGIDYVIVNGKIVVQQGEHTEQTPGLVLSM